MDWKAKADELLSDFNLCCRAKPKQNVVDLQLQKDAVAKWAYHLNHQLAWGTDFEIAEACHQLEPRLIELKEKVVIEILKDGKIQN